MRRCRIITGWTDYPFTELGDTPYVNAPVRHVRVLSYDGNKYCKVSVFDQPKRLLEVKAGYLYTKRGRYGQVPNINLRKLNRMINEKGLA